MTTKTGRIKLEDSWRYINLTMGYWKLLNNKASKNTIGSTMINQWIYFWKADGFDCCCFEVWNPSVYCVQKQKRHHEFNHYTYVYIYILYIYTIIFKSLDEGFSTFSMVCACLNPPPCIKVAFFFPSSKVLVSQPYSWKTFPYSKDFSGPSVFPQWRLALKAAKNKLLCFEWSPPWHFKTACWHHFCLKLLSRDFCPTNYPNHLFHLAGHCACQSVKQDINMSVGHVK